MKQTMLLKLAPTEEQKQALLETMHAFNLACTHVGEVAYTNKSTSKFDLQKECYRDLRATYKLSAQLAILAIHKAAGAYKRERTTKPTFRPEGAITYDQRIMSFKGLTHVSLLTLSGRVIIPFLVGGYQQARLDAMKGQADLIYRKGVFYLAVTLDVPEPSPYDTTDTLGVDLGIVNLATDSTGETFSSEAVEKNRQRMHSLKQRLQRRGTQSARRHLRKLSGKQARFQKNTNHVISKRLVQKAKQSTQAIAIEELRHIRQRTERTVRHSQRARQSNWSFWQLRFFLSYKAALAGVPLYTVDPRNTSRTCSQCGHCEKGNRKSQACFCCKKCGHSDNADRNAAINIARASVMVPIVESESSRDNRLFG
ncbi:MAG: RNA-guided endonuclease InsQ/TnpB family protein [Ktedonobacteraceae bacterium]